MGASVSEPSAFAQAVARRVRALLSEAEAGPGWPLPPDEDGAAWTAAATGALDRLLADGRLDQPDGFRGRLAHALDLLARGPMARGLLDQPGRGRLLGELLRNLDQPGRINQGHKGTCAAACAELHLAERHPAEYARLVAGLCTPMGAVGLRNGGALCRDEPGLAWAAAEEHRGPVSALFQVAVMEAAYPDRDYRNAEDAQFDPQDTQAPGEAGLGLGAFDQVLEGLTGQEWAALTDQNDDIAALMGLDPRAVLSLERDGEGIVRRALAAGDALFATLAGPAPPDAAGRHPLLALPHKVRLVALDPTTETVLYDDPLDPARPWIPGARSEVVDRDGRCRMPLVDLLGLLVELSYPPRHAPEGR